MPGGATLPPAVQRLLEEAQGGPAAASPALVSPLEQQQIGQAAAMSIMPDVGVQQPQQEDPGSALLRFVTENQAAIDALEEQQHNEEMAGRIADLRSMSFTPEQMVPMDTAPQPQPAPAPAPQPQRTGPSIESGTVQTGQVGPEEFHTDAAPGGTPDAAPNLPGQPGIALQRANGDVITVNPFGPGARGRNADEMLQNYLSTNPDRLTIRERAELVAELSAQAASPTTPRRGAQTVERRDVGIERVIDGPVDDAALERAANAEADFRQGQHDQLQTISDLYRGAEVAQQEQARQIEANAAIMADFEERVQAEAQERMQAVDTAMDVVRTGRVDPEQFFGGWGGRLGATLAVALGQLGSALAGGPNTALEIINAGIERNIRAQETNLQQGRAALQGEMQALGMFRQLTGDERAAESAARDAHLAAVQSRLEGMMAGLTGNKAVAAQMLLNAFAERQEANAEIDRQKRNGAIAESVRRTSIGTRGGIESVAGARAGEVAAANTTHRMETAVEEVAAAFATPDPEERAARFRQAYARADEAHELGRAGRPGAFEEAEVVWRALLAGPSDAMTPEQRTAVEGALEQTRISREIHEGVELPSGLRDVSQETRVAARRARGGGAAQRRRYQRRIREREREIAAQRASEPQIPSTEEAAEQARRAAASLTRAGIDRAGEVLEHEAEVPTPPTDFYGLRLTRPQHFEQMVGTSAGQGLNPEALTGLVETSAAVQQLDQFVQFVVGTRQRLGMGLRPEANYQRMVSQMLSTRIGAEFVTSIFGANFTGGEQEIANKMRPPDPNSPTAGNLVRIDEVLNQLSAFAAMRYMQLHTQARAWGFSVDSPYIRSIDTETDQVNVRDIVALSRQRDGGRSGGRSAPAQPTQTRGEFAGRGRRDRRAVRPE